MKSRRRFGVSRFPFRKSKRHEKKTTREDEDDQSIQTESIQTESIQTESIQTESIQSVVSIHEEEKELKHDEEKELKHEEKELTQEEELALLTTHAEDPGSDGEECELHIYENRVDARGESVLLRAGTSSRIVPPKRKSHRACLILTRYFNSNQSDRPNRTFLDIQSRHIVEALRSVIGKYSGVDFTSKIVTIQEPPKCLFHYRDELRQYAEASDNQDLKAHMQLCLQYTEKTLHEEIRLFESFRSGSSLAPELEHRHLWMAFKPGCLVHARVYGNEMLLRLRSMEMKKSEDNGNNNESWILYAEGVDRIGNMIGLTHYCLRVMHYNGRRNVISLSSIPLQFHPEEQRIRRELLERGRKFLSLFGINHFFYDGVAQMCSAFAPRPNATVHTNVKHRIMVDSEQYDRNVGARPQVSFVPDTYVYHYANEAKEKLSDEDISTCSAVLQGFSLQLRAWGTFHVSHIKEVAYNDEAFHGLLLSEQKKILISSLVAHQSSGDNDHFDDLVQGKGKGTIFLLYGGPGLGKTYTAESIADHRRRPLLKITSGELGVYGPANSSEKEERLMQLFSLATRWNAIILLDEADVFMQERSIDNLEGNWLVSTLLRVLEYYEGILFLTTNRVETIDSAFRSRIHLAIAYQPLSADARRQLWSSTIIRANCGQAPEWLSPDMLKTLGEMAVNGREIRNLVRTGLVIARSEGRELESVDLLQGLEAWKQFETDFKEISQERKTKVS